MPNGTYSHEHQLGGRSSLTALNHLLCQMGHIVHAFVLLIRSELDLNRHPRSIAALHHGV